MSIRFRKSINLGPAFKINISKSGLSFTARVPGMKGLSLSTGSKGTYLNAGLPGTGLSSRTKLSGKGVGVSFRDIGEKIKGASGKGTEAEGEEGKAAASPSKHAEALPPEGPSLEETLMPYLTLHQKAPTVGALDAGTAPDETAVEGATEGVLKKLCVPYVFSASYEYDEGTQALLLDIDLPEIEDIPDEEDEIGKAGKTVHRRIPAADAHAHYATCVFSLCLYLAATIFSEVPSLAHIVCSGYTQRRDSKGDLKDVYIVSIRFEREGLAGRDLSQVADPETFCMGFENRCAKTSTGLFRKISPYESISKDGDQRG